ncbi:MAG: 16S rRNA (cytidine(1402)-2'-O)-methyltransferase [Clostridia bacterium]|nr:16S rRNA (cytidine(1402)-2'-O)-methyltransferase [Clostridia bacterium]
MEKEVTEKTLYVVATPIGNLSDMTERAKRILSQVDFVAAEDTRISGKLLGLYGIRKPLVNYFEHNRTEMGEKIVSRLLSGECCAIVTDAGTPAISDPGEDLCRLCHEKGITVVPIPGCSAAITALSASGMPSRRFTFEGFLPREKKEQRELLDELQSEKRTMIFYEAPHRLKKTLDAFYQAFGDRDVCLAREITKLNEEIVKTTLDKAVEIYREKEPRGEYAIIIAGATTIKTDCFWDNMSIAEHVQFYISQGLPKMDAIKKTAKDRGVPKNDIYKEMI